MNCSVMCETYYIIVMGSAIILPCKQRQGEVKVRFYY